MTRSWVGPTSRFYGRTTGVARTGVLDAADVREKLAAGAVLVQLYTGLVYGGPGVVREILSDGRGA